MNPFRSLYDYEGFIYSLSRQFPRLARSTLTLIRRGKYRGEVMGELLFLAGIRLTVYEYLTWEHEAVVIEGYSYEVWNGSEKVYWYDSQPHPNDPTLASTHPHHKHVPPDIKHHRIPAPELSFTRPNLSFLIEEIERELLTGHAGAVGQP
ncbi:MAG: DUF6516 family protein [Ardenticatenaceae bacterium]|nr:DUF6516 family protein [Ardenticatenaceae bacterium]